MNELKKEIQTAKRKLIRTAYKKGLYENFGQKEVRKLKDKHIDTSNYSLDMKEKINLLDQFNDWCMNFTGFEEAWRNGRNGKE